MKYEQCRTKCQKPKYIPITVGRLVCHTGNDPQVKRQKPIQLINHGTHTHTQVYMQHTLMHTLVSSLIVNKHAHKRTDHIKSLQCVCKYAFI